MDFGILFNIWFWATTVSVNGPRLSANEIGFALVEDWTISETL
ncbi:putative proline-rich receptor-like protein kinase PERK3 [Iris pallida]|uniref:Proline-rich receptor-like protein kinase PERK3 n=1 Tax=Iris pallida TaxID=29817 RepID=A0AAX6G947_IRIPA|nr:putative proline-rich receptor-like protein kinase PERK3 [Iris pallida]